MFAFRNDYKMLVASGGGGRGVGSNSIIFACEPLMSKMKTVIYPKSTQGRQTRAAKILHHLDLS